ncbi:fibronectin type III domain-containing protein [Levilactobacillus angrenensis]|uniref:fibronectin type III domain-containing protein n=1 Tax=Levilactobacillus angrenensis TaxID=2486020 RepID=UPI000F7B7DED|nr:fibronectin type III domain-containing protein [Levilactobacillus angrenensis]
MASNDEQRSATTIFTTAAQSIAARLIANKTTAKFTKAEISTTNLFNQSVTELQVLTSLDNVQQTADINTVTVINDSTVDVNIAIDQTKAPNDYQMNSVGLFAVDGDGKEVLYSVTVLKDPVYIHQDAMGSALGIDLETVVGQSSNVDLSINPAGAVTNEELKVTLADYVKTDDVKSLIPATVIDGSKPADFKESVTLEKGAVDGEGNAIATTKDVSDGDAEALTSAKEYADTQVGDKVKAADTVNWQKHKLTGDDGSAKFVIASGEDVDTKLKAIIGTKDTGKLLVDIDAKNNPTGHSLIGEYFCDFDGLVTGYGIGPDGAMWSFTYNGTTTIWKWILTAKTPGIPKLAVKYNATSKAFDYTLTAPEKDGFSDILQYNLLWKDHSVDDWTTVIVKPDDLTGQLTGVDIPKTYDFKAAAQNAVGSSDYTDVITLGTAVVPGIPSLTVEYDAGKKGFDYTVTAPKSDGGSEITGYSLEYQKQGSTDWMKVALNPDSLTGTVTDGIEAGSDYLFRLNAENAAGSSGYFTVSDPLPTVDGNIYGVSWDGSSSGALQRTDAAVGLKAGINGAQNDFDTRGPWGLMDKTVTDSYGNTFVRVPKFYIRKTQDKNKPLSTWQVSLVKQGDDWYLPNCFYDFGNKKELDYVDVSRYEGSIASGKLQSKTGATPTASQTIVQLRSSAVANNTDGKKGYHLWDVHTLDALQVLFTIEFATLDSQSIMKGNTDNTGNSLMNNGATDNVKGSSGFVTSGAKPMTYRGIENLYGNLAMWTDGLNINSLSLYSCDDATKYASDVFTSPYYKLNYSLNSENGNITGLGFDKEHPGVTAPTSFNSDSYNTYYHDYGYVYGSGNYVVYTGGGWFWHAGSSGLWFWYGSYSSSDAYSYVGSRLLKKAL